MAMNAVNALDTQLRDSKRLAEQRAHEPSMEEILASIRRIIADDDVLPLTRPAPEVKAAAPAPPPVKAETPVAAPPPRLRLAPITPLVFPPDELISPPPVAQAEAAEPGVPLADVAAAPIELPPQPVALTVIEPDQNPEPETPMAHEARAVFETHAAFEDEAQPILSARTDESVATSLNALASSVFLQQTGMIEESIKDMLRPLLKTWLDDNLPVIVERLVRIEIERVARGGR